LIELRQVKACLPNENQDEFFSRPDVALMTIIAIGEFCEATSHS
jgi:hypothetical protein